MEGQTPDFELAEYSTFGNQKKNEAPNPEAQMRLGLISLVFPVNMGKGTSDQVKR